MLEVECDVGRILQEIFWASPTITFGGRQWKDFYVGVVLSGMFKVPLHRQLTLFHFIIRCADTFSNYLAYARIGTLLVNGCDKAFDEKIVLRRAREAIRKRGLFTPRPKLFLRFNVVQNMVDHAARLPDFASTAMWALTAYTFMLR